MNKIPSGVQARQGVLIALKSIAEHLTPAEQRAARYVLDNVDAVVDMSVMQLAAAAGVGESTIIRLCNHLGIPGYSALKLALAREWNDVRPRLTGDVRPDSTIEEIVDRVFASEVKDIEDTARLLDIGTLRAVIEALEKANRTICYGAGPSGYVALDFAQKLMRLGLTCLGYNDPHLALTASALSTPLDVLVTFSYSGRTKDGIRFLEVGHQKGATTIAITSSVGSPITRYATHVLYSASNEGALRTGATSSRLAQLSLVDVIFVGLAAPRFWEVVDGLNESYWALENHRV